MAPITKMSGAGPKGKVGAGLPGKSSGGKSFSFGSTSKSANLGKSPTLPKSSGLPSTSSSKTYATPMSSSSKSGKSSVGFGIIWLPGRRNNKKKDVVWSPHNDYKHSKDRSPSMYNFMSGDSQPYQKKEEEVDLLVPERTKGQAVVNAGTAVAAVDVASGTVELNKPEEKQGFLKFDKEESKEAAGDTNDKDDKSDKDYLETNDVTNKFPECKTEKIKEIGDKVDSVYLRPPPPHKTRSAASVDENEDCGIKCLYYTLQCCDCVLM